MLPVMLDNSMMSGIALLTCLGLAASLGAQEPVSFEGATDVGPVSQKGEVRYDPDRKEYRLTGGGENMWGSKDAFHYAWRRLSGDVTLVAEVTFPDREGDAHRKAGWVVRQDLEPDAPYADAVVHADGLISLQYRLVRGGPTQQVTSPIRAPARVRLERAGDLFALSVARPAGPFQPVGAVTVALADPVYVGLGVCAHDAGAVATAIARDVELAGHGVIAADKRLLESRLETVDVETGERRVVHETRDHIEAPNWSRDGSTIYFNGGGRLYAIPAAGGPPRLVPTGGLDRLNNDHGLSPDGRSMAISHHAGGPSLVYVVPAQGGEPRQVTAKGPSYWHGWSPDGKTLAYCAEREGEYDIYTIAADAEKSAEEKRLTSASGLDDGPDYAPDGDIFFNSVRAGVMRIWRMKPDGTEQRQVTFDEAWADWFPHPSPDGRWLAFLSYDKSVEGHPPNKDVALRLMSLEGGEPRILVRLFGGQGTINVPSWSPDSKSFAFVSYRLVRP